MTWAGKGSTIAPQTRPDAVMRRQIFLVLLALPLSGCMILGTAADRKVQKTPSFREGYEDGCASATNAGANLRRGDIVRDDALYETDKAYRAGWANGHAACSASLTGKSQPPLNPNPGGGGIPR